MISISWTSVTWLDATRRGSRSCTFGILGGGAPVACPRASPPPLRRGPRPGRCGLFGLGRARRRTLRGDRSDDHGRRWRPPRRPRRPPRPRARAPRPTVDPDVRLPEGMPAIVDDPADLAAIASGDLGPLAPPGASDENRSTIDDPFEQIVLTWSDGVPPEGRNGLIVWQRSEDGTWRAVYAFTDPARRGVFGIRVDTGDLTGDAIPDILSFEDVGGSGACGTYRVIATSGGRRERDLPTRSLRHPDRDLIGRSPDPRGGLPRRRPALLPERVPRVRPALERHLLGRDLVGGRPERPRLTAPAPRRPVARPPCVARRRTRAAKGLRRPSERPIQGAIPAIDVGKGRV